MLLIFGRLKSFIAYAGLFSLCINLLLLVPSLYMLQVFDRVLSSRSEETLVMLTVFTVGALGTMGALDWLRSRLLTLAGVRLERMIGPEVLAGLLRSAARIGGSEYVHGLRDVAMVRGFLAGPGIVSLFDAPWLPLYLAVIVLFHPLMGAVSLAGALTLIVIGVLNERLTRPPLEHSLNHSRRTGRYIELGLRNAEVVSALGMVGPVTDKWRRLNNEVLAAQVAASRAGSALAGWTKFVRWGTQSLVLGLGAWLVIDQHISAGVMIAATIILGRALHPVEALVVGWRGIIEAHGAAKRLSQLLAATSSHPKPTELPEPLGVLSVEQAAFSAPHGERPILRGVSLALAAGESLGLIGPSASGKSTLARLIVGVWPPQSGVVRLDGADIASWPRERLGRHIGYLPQDVELISGTVAENIARLGPIDDELVVEAARRAHAHDMILRLPQGYDTPIGEGGAALSGGQRQRVALARALYGNPCLVVLDEPNANLDAEGEAALARTIGDLKRLGVTVVVITHRPSLLAEIDKVLVLSEGTVQMFGPRSDVMPRVTGVAPAHSGLKAV